MINFTESTTAAQKVAMHYAKNLVDEFAQQVLLNEADITCPEEAEKFTRFYWAMVDLAVEDQEQGKIIEGVADLEYWMEKLLNIVMGYINRVGLGLYWTRVSDEINGR